MSISLKRTIAPAVALLALTAPTAVFAADGDLGTNSTATVSVTPGSLTLVQAPSFNFGKITLESLVPKAKDSAILSSQNEDGLVVSDYTGSGSGWVVSAAITPFAVDKADAKTILTGQLALKSPAVVGETEATTASLGTAALITGSTAGQPGNSVNILSAAAGKGQGNNIVDFKPDTASLALDKNVYAAGKDYSATITWTLAATVTATTPTNG